MINLVTMICTQADTFQPLYWDLLIHSLVVDKITGKKQSKLEGESLIKLMATENFWLKCSNPQFIVSCPIKD